MGLLLDGNAAGAALASGTQHHPSAELLSSSGKLMWSWCHWRSRPQDPEGPSVKMGETLHSRAPWGPCPEITDPQPVPTKIKKAHLLGWALREAVAQQMCLMMNELLGPQGMTPGWPCCGAVPRLLSMHNLISLFSSRAHRLAQGDLLSLC